MAPCENSASVVGVPTPNPTCVFPRPALMDWVTRSWKETSLALNPMVLRLARLLPVTEMAVEKAESAESAVENDRGTHAPYELVVPDVGCWVDPESAVKVLLMLSRSERI